MKKLVIALTAAVALAAGVAYAADLNPSQLGVSCETEAVYHFVNNQTGGAAAGTVTATIGGDTITVGATTVLKNTQHFFITAVGELTAASSSLQGNLVLSDFDCGDDKKDPDPK